MGEGFTPLVLGSHGVGGARAPPGLDLSLFFSLVLRSVLALFHRFVYIWRSVTPIGLKLRRDFFPNISFLAEKEERQLPYGGLTRVGARPKGGRPLPRDHLGHWFALIFLPNFPYFPKISSVRFYPVWTPFDMDILRNQKHATDRNWHWALDQYVSPKNNIKSCQKVYES